jgi:hypothetical protein
MQSPQTSSTHSAGSGANKSTQKSTIETRQRVASRKRNHSRSDEEGSEGEGSIEKGTDVQKDVTAVEESKVYYFGVSTIKFIPFFNFTSTNMRKCTQTKKYQNDHTYAVC